MHGGIEMVDLIGRSVEINYGAMYAPVLGVVEKDLPESVWIRTDDGDSKHVAKWRLLTNEYPFSDIPTAVGVYLIAKPNSQSELF